MAGMNGYANIPFSTFAFALVGTAVLALLLPGNTGIYLMAGLFILYLLHSGGIGSIAAGINAAGRAAGVSNSPDF